MMIFISICTSIFIFQIEQGFCTKQALLLRNEGKYLANHIIETKQADSEFECGTNCVANKACMSVNYKTSGVGIGRCEINDKTVREVPDEERRDPEFIHLAVFKRVSKTTHMISYIQISQWQNIADITRHLIVACVS